MGCIMQIKGTSEYKEKIGLDLYAVENARERGIVWIKAASRPGAQGVGPYSRYALFEGTILRKLGRVGLVVRSIHIGYVERQA